MVLDVSVMKLWKILQFSHVTILRDAIQSWTDLEVIDLEDGLWVRQVVLLQVCIETRFWRAKIWDPSSCARRNHEKLLKQDKNGLLYSLKINGVYLHVDIPAPTMQMMFLPMTERGKNIHDKWIHDSVMNPLMNNLALSKSYFLFLGECPQIKYISFIIIIIFSEFITLKIPRNKVKHNKTKLTFAAAYVARHALQRQLIQNFLWRAQPQHTGEEAAQDVHWKGQERKGKTRSVYSRFHIKNLYFLCHYISIIWCVAH